MKTYIRIFVTALLTTIASSVLAIDAEEDRAIDELLSVPPNTRLEQATAVGDTSFIASPECTTAVVGPIPAYFLSQKGNTVIDPNCRLLYGKQGNERYRRLRQYASDYNHLMLAYMKANGLFNIWPSNTSRQLILTSDEQAVLGVRGKKILHAIFGESLPPSLKAQTPEIWKGNRLKLPFKTGKDGNPEREDFESRLWQRAHMTAAEFVRHFKANDWRQIPFPQEFFERTGDKRFEKISPTSPESAPLLALLSRGGICFVGKVNDLPAYVIWFQADEFLNVILALDPPRYY